MTYKECERAKRWSYIKGFAAGIGVCIVYRLCVWCLVAAAAYAASGNAGEAIEMASSVTSE